MIFSVPRNTNDCDRLIQPFGIINPELPANRILPSEEILNHGLVDDRYARRSGRVLGFNAAAGEDGNAHNSKIIRSHKVFSRSAIIGAHSLKSGHDDGVGALSTAEQTIGGIGDGLHSRSARETRSQLRRQELHVLSVVSSTRGISTRDDQVITVVSEILSHEFLQAAH